MRPASIQAPKRQSPGRPVDSNPDVDHNTYLHVPDMTPPTRPHAQQFFKDTLSSSGRIGAQPSSQTNTSITLSNKPNSRPLPFPNQPRWRSSSHLKIDNPALHGRYKAEDWLVFAVGEDCCVSCSAFFCWRPFSNLSTVRDTGQIILVGQWQ